MAILSLLANNHPRMFLDNKCNGFDSHEPGRSNAILSPALEVCRVGREYRMVDSIRDTCMDFNSGLNMSVNLGNN